MAYDPISFKFVADTTQFEPSFVSMQKLMVDLASDTARLGAELQKTEAVFGVLAGSIEKGSSLLRDLNQLAIESPFSAKQTQHAAQALMGMGVAVDQLIPTISRLGDMAVGDEQKLYRLALAAGQVTAAGKLMGQELRQFTNAGVSVQDFADTMGINTHQFRSRMVAGQVDPNVIYRTVNRLTSEGGRFYDMTGTVNQTLMGQVNQLVEKWQYLDAQFGKKFIEKFDITGIFARANDWLGEHGGMFAEPLLNSFDHAFNFIRRSWQQVVWAFEGVDWQEIWDKAVQGASDFLDYMEGIWTQYVVPGAEWAWGKITEGWDYVTKFVKDHWDDVKNALVAGMDHVMGFGSKLFNVIAAPWEGFHFDLTWQDAANAAKGMLVTIEAMAAVTAHIASGAARIATEFGQATVVGGRLVKQVADTKEGSEFGDATWKFIKSFVDGSSPGERLSSSLNLLYTNTEFGKSVLGKAAEVFLGPTVGTGKFSAQTYSYGKSYSDLPGIEGMGTGRADIPRDENGMPITPYTKGGSTTGGGDFGSWADTMRDKAKDWVKDNMIGKIGAAAAGPLSGILGGLAGPTDWMAKGKDPHAMMLEFFDKGGDRDALIGSQVGEAWSMEAPAGPRNWFQRNLFDPLYGPNQEKYGVGRGTQAGLIDTPLALSGEANKLAEHLGQSIIKGVNENQKANQMIGLLDELDQYREGIGMRDPFRDEKGGKRTKEERQKIQRDNADLKWLHDTGEFGDQQILGENEMNRGLFEAFQLKQAMVGKNNLSDLFPAAELQGSSAARDTENRSLDEQRSTEQQVLETLIEANEIAKRREKYEQEVADAMKKLKGSRPELFRTKGGDS